MRHNRYKFDVNLEALSTVKERMVWMIFMGIVFFFLYGVSNHIASITMPHPSLYMPWERNIPFVSDFIVPYMSSDIMFIIAFLFPYKRYELRVLAARVLFIVLFSSIIFILFPLSFAFEKPPINDYGFLFGLLEADKPYNQLPSLHISFAIVLWASMMLYLHNKIVKYFVAFWFMLIVVSTLFVFQHHFIDLPTGLLMGLLAIYLIDNNNPIIVQFTTPRHIKMGLYYLMSSVLFAILAFTFSPIFIWFSISLLMVSLIYAFGLNMLLAGNNAKANIFQWSLFAPYFIGNHISWLFYKRRLEFVAHVGENLYIGRQPTMDEYEHLKSKNIANIINLATEQQLHTSYMPQTRLALLDQVIQPPQDLHRGVLLIEEMMDSGVFVHCAFGLSRSVLLISSWLIYRGNTIEQVEEILSRIRPDYVKSPYMRITLEIYQEHLTTL